MNISSAWKCAFRVQLSLWLLLISGCSGCSGLLFFPSPQMVLTPEKLGLDHREITLTTQDGVELHNWLLLPKNPTHVKGTILFLHGNAENISTHIINVAWLTLQGYEVFLLDYRGYGKSEGVPLLPDVLLDIEAADTWLAARAQETRLPIYILGQSLGASLAAYYIGSRNPSTERLPLNGLVLDAPFYSARQIAREKLGGSWLTWAIQYPLSFLITDKYSPSQTAALISPTPVLIFHSPDDRIIPAHHSRLLQEQLKPPYQRILTQGPHIATFNYLEHQQQLLEFLSKNATTPLARTVIISPSP